MTEQPNILVLMVDQWRGDCLSAAGHPVVKTPYLDRLAARGTRFTHAYSASPTCIPARASLHTGMSAASHGRVGYQDLVPWNYEVTLAGELTRAGYQSQAVGKMHVYPERTQLGFQNVILHSPTGIVRSARQQGKDPGLVDDYLPWLRQQLGRDATYFDHGVDSNSYVARPWDKPEHTHPTNFVATQAADFLRRRDQRKPFFLFASFNAPHPPYDPPDWAFQQYIDAPTPDPPVGDWQDYYAEFEDPANPSAGVTQIDETMLRRARAGYYGHITHVDQQISYLLAELDHHGVAENTYICFISDHGEMLGDHHMFRKGYPYEGSARIPMLISGPGMRPGHVSDEIVELRDVMPTLLECAGAPIPDQVEGHSLHNITHGGSDPVREYLHGEHLMFGQSLQWLTDTHTKYVWMSATGREQLFDLDHDPQETHNLASDPAWTQTLTTWRTRLIQELTGREEGFTDGEQLFPGRPVSPCLTHATTSGSST